MFHFIFLIRIWIRRIQTDEPVRQGNHDEDHRERKNHPKIFEFTSATEIDREIEQQVGAEGEKERNTPESKNRNPGFCFRSSRYHGPWGSGDFLIFGIVRDFQNLIGVILTFKHFIAEVFPGLDPEQAKGLNLPNDTSPAAGQPSVGNFIFRTGFVEMLSDSFQGIDKPDQFVIDAGCTLCDFLGIPILVLITPEIFDNA